MVFTNDDPEKANIHLCEAEVAASTFCRDNRTNWLLSPPLEIRQGLLRKRTTKKYQANPRSSIALSRTMHPISHAENVAISFQSSSTIALEGMPISPSMVSTLNTKPVGPDTTTWRIDYPSSSMRDQDACNESSKDSSGHEHTGAEISRLPGERPASLPDPLESGLLCILSYELEDSVAYDGSE